MTGLAVLGGFVLDTLFGDPAWLPHPVVLMGKAISALEKRLRARLPKTPQGELLGGGIVAFCLPVGTFVCTGLVCLGAAKLSPWLGLAVQMFWCGQALAAKGLAQESMNVHKELVKGDLPAARKAVSRIVGRDTQNLTAEGVTKAAVETVAENASDGVIAPLLYMLIGGAAYYFGEYYPKPTIGDALRPIEPEDIRRANKMMYAESLLALLLGLAIRGVIL